MPPQHESAARDGAAAESSAKLRVDDARVVPAPAPGEVPPNSPTLVVAASLIWVVRSVAPLSFAYLLWRIVSYMSGRHRTILFSRSSLAGRFLSTWTLAEALFFGYCEYVKRKTTYSRREPPELSPHDRGLLFERCVRLAGDRREFVRSWFAGKRATFNDLKRDNIREWLAWGILHRPSFDALRSKDEEVELESYVVRLETELGQPFPPGYNAEAKLLKFSEEPIVAAHRPLALYGIIHGLLQEVVAPYMMRARGFRPDRVGSLSYWYRPGRKVTSPAGTRERTPIVLLHGIGVGPVPYYRVVDALMERVDMPDGANGFAGRPLMVLELHAVSQRLAPPELHRDGFVAETRAALALVGHPEGAIFIGHSWGTFCLGWLVRNAPDLVLGACFCDPVCFLLHHTDVLKSILYMEPSSLLEEVLHYIVRAELFFNCYMRRSVYWSINILFLEDIPAATPTCVVLSENDNIVPVESVREYIQQFQQGTSPVQRVVGINEECSFSSSGVGGAKVRLLYLENLEHGGFLFKDEAMEQVLHEVDLVSGACRS